MYGWSDDKKSMYVSSNKRNSKFFDLWKLDTARWEPQYFTRMIWVMTRGNQQN
ncbi:MAG: hypothetical protein WKG06_02390 [Segetibacter sp.]